MVTLLCGSASVPAAGDCLTTVPCGLVEWASTFGTTSNWESALSAALCCMPLTLGTLIFCGPVETYSVTFEPGAATPPPGGLVLITLFLVTVEDGWSTTFGTNPAFVIAALAVSTLCPATEGIVLPELPPPRMRYATPATTASTTSTPKAHSSMVRRRLLPPGG